MATKRLQGQNKSYWGPKITWGLKCVIPGSTFIVPCYDNQICCPVNALRLSDVIRRHGSGSALAQIMTCCLTATSHQLNQFLLIISGVLWHSSDDHFTASFRIATLYNRSKNNTFRITATPPRDQWVKEQYTYNFNGIPNWPTRVLSLFFFTIFDGQIYWHLNLEVVKCLKKCC